MLTDNANNMPQSSSIDAQEQEQSQSQTKYKCDISLFIEKEFTNLYRHITINRIFNPDGVTYKKEILNSYAITKEQLLSSTNKGVKKGCTTLLYYCIKTYKTPLCN